MNSKNVNLGQTRYLLCFPTKGFKLKSLQNQKIIKSKNPLPIKQINFFEKNISGLDLCNSNMRGCDLRWFDCSGTNFSHADLSYADLYYANLENANLTGAITNNTKFNNAEIRKTKGIFTTDFGNNAILQLYYIIAHRQSNNQLKKFCETLEQGPQEPISLGKYFDVDLNHYHDKLNTPINIILGQLLEQDTIQNCEISRYIHDYCQKFIK